MIIANIAGQPNVIKGDQALPVQITDESIPVFVDALLADAPAIGNIPCGRPKEFDPRGLLAPTWGARSIIGLGYNYRAHVEETGHAREPLVFLRAQSSIAPPNAAIKIQGAQWDYEAELVFVIGKPASRVSMDQAWQHIGGFMAGQDITDRAVQRGGQLCLSKSRPGTGPIGPYLVTRDEFEPDLGGLYISCSLNGVQMQCAPITDMTWNVQEIVSRISYMVDLSPGDLIFSGSPAGIGMYREPSVFLRAGDLLETRIDGIGRLTNVCE